MTPAIDPASIEGVEVEADTMDEAVSAVAIAVPEAVGDCVTADEYQTYFVKTAVEVEGEEGKWLVTARLDPSVVLPVDGGEGNALSDMLNSVAALALGTAEAASVPTNSARN